VGKAGAKRNTVGVEWVLGLLLRKVLVAVDGRGHGKVPVVNEMLGNVCKVVVFLLGERGGAVLVRWEARNVESSGSGRGGVWGICRGRADAACAEPIEERCAVVVLGA
jgi:hypothetical protein